MYDPMLNSVYAYMDAKYTNKEIIWMIFCLIESCHVK